MLLMAAGARDGLRKSFPLLAGVTLGKLFVHLSLALGLWRIIENFPRALFALKIAGAIYVLWLASKIIKVRIQEGRQAAGFIAGLAVHPLNPKAWAMVVAAYGQFIEAEGEWWQQTLIVALVFFCWQCIAHTFWCWSGVRAAKLLSGTRAESRLMLIMAALMVAAVLWSLWSG